MLKSDVISHFGSQTAAAAALGITKAAVNHWPKIVPQGSAYKYQVITGGKLRVDASMYPSAKRPTQAVA